MLDFLVYFHIPIVLVKLFHSHTLIMLLVSIHITLEVTDSLRMKLELVIMPSLAELMSEYILELSPRIPMLSQALISGVLKSKSNEDEIK